jgi:hypothetical protein
MGANPRGARGLIAALVAALALALNAGAAAQGRAPAEARHAAAAEEVLAAREKIRAAIAAKDRAALEAAYADNFSHLRDSGRIDLKDERIALLLSGETTIETAPEDGVVVQVYGPATAVATGTSAIPDPAAKRPASFRWVIVYAKDEGGWKVALSQASRITRRR